jgi:hypothetical protein
VDDLGVALAIKEGRLSATPAGEYRNGYQFNSPFYQESFATAAT